ncbi:hypothetical protein KBF38_11345 [bacterium]|nr:hypothetical protein [bacterium]
MLTFFLPGTEALAQASLNQAIALYNKNDFASCSSLLSKDINGSLRNNASAHYYLASAYLRLGQNNAAVEHYLATSRLAPGTVYDTYSKKALQSIMARAGNVPEAIKDQIKRQSSQGQAQTAASTGSNTESNSSSSGRVSEIDDPTLASATLKDVDSSFITVLRHTADTDRALIQVCRALKLVPKQIVDDLKGGGITVLVTPTVLEAKPGSAMEKPRGYNNGGGYTNAGALFSHPRIVIGERVSYLSGVAQPNNSVASAMLHEMGHAYDHVRGGLSHKGKFKDCYQQDFGHITNTQRTKHSYYTQEGDAGASELFAQLFSYDIYKSQVRNDQEAADLQATFPLCTKYMSDLIRSNR